MPVKKNNLTQKVQKPGSQTRCANAWALHSEPADRGYIGISWLKKDTESWDDTFLLGVTDATGGLKVIPLILYASKSSVAGL